MQSSLNSCPFPSSDGMKRHFSSRVMITAPVKILGSRITSSCERSVRRDGRRDRQCARHYVGGKLLEQLVVEHDFGGNVEEFLWSGLRHDLLLQHVVVLDHHQHHTTLLDDLEHVLLEHPLLEPLHQLL